MNFIRKYGNRPRSLLCVCWIYCWRISVSGFSTLIYVILWAIINHLSSRSGPSIFVIFFKPPSNWLPSLLAIYLVPWRIRVDRPDYYGLFISTWMATICLTYCRNSSWHSFQEILKGETGDLTPFRMNSTVQLCEIWWTRIQLPVTSFNVVWEMLNCIHSGGHLWNVKSVSHSRNNSWRIV